MENLVELKKEELNLINAGRFVDKIDYDGDGRWDRKDVYDNDGNLIRTVFRY